VSWLKMGRTGRRRTKRVAALETQDRPGADELDFFRGTSLEAGQGSKPAERGPAGDGVYESNPRMIVPCR